MVGVQRVGDFNVIDAPTVSDETRFVVHDADDNLPGNVGLMALISAFKFIYDDAHEEIISGVRVYKTLEELRATSIVNFKAAYVQENASMYLFDETSVANEDGVNTIIPQANQDGAFVVSLNIAAELQDIKNDITATMSVAAGLSEEVAANDNDIDGLGTQINEIDSRVTQLFEVLQSDDVNLDELQEIVNFIGANRTRLDDLGINGVVGLATALDDLTNAIIDNRTAAETATATTNTRIDNLGTGNIADLDQQIQGLQQADQNNSTAIAAANNRIDNLGTSNVAGLDPAIQGLQQADQINSTAIAAANNRIDNLGTSNVAGLDGTISNLQSADSDNAAGIVDVNVRLDQVLALLESDNVDLDNLQEVVDFIEDNRDQLNALGIGSVIGLQAALDQLGQTDQQLESDIADNAQALTQLEQLSAEIEKTLLNTYQREATLAQVDITAAADGLLAFTINKFGNDSIGGMWAWNSDNLNLAVSKDPLQTIFLPPASDPTGASGAWVREFSGAVQMVWGGFDWTGASDQTNRLSQFFETFNTRTFDDLLSDVIIEAPNIGNKRLLIDGAGPDAGGVIVRGVRAHMVVDWGNTRIICGTPSNKLDNAAMLFSTNTPFDFDNRPRVRFERGHWDIRNMKNSMVVPFREEVGVVEQGASNVCDALNIRTTYLDGTVRRNGWESFELVDCKFTASNGTWETAGGDSGCYVEGVDKFIACRVKGRGLRDTILYPSRRDGQETTNMRVVCIDLEADGCFFAITPKRELREVYIFGGYAHNCVRGLDFSTGLPLSSGLDSVGGGQYVIDNFEFDGCEVAINVEDADDVTIGSSVVVRNPGYKKNDGTRLGLGFDPAGIVFQGVRDFVVNNPKMSGVNDNIETGSKSAIAGLVLAGIEVNDIMRGCSNGQAEVTVTGRGAGSGVGFLQPVINTAYGAAEAAKRTNNCVVKANSLDCSTSNIIEAGDGEGNLFESLDINEGGLSSDAFVDWADQASTPPPPADAGRNRLYFEGGILYSLASDGTPVRITPTVAPPEFRFVSGATESISSVGNDQLVSEIIVPAETIDGGDELIARFGFEAFGSGSIGAANIIPKLQISDGGASPLTIAGDALTSGEDGLIEISLLNIASGSFRASVKIFTSNNPGDNPVVFEGTASVNINNQISIALVADITSGGIRARSRSARVI